MVVATMTSKGQITIPKEIRDALGLEPGTKVSFTPYGPGEVRLRVKRRRLKDLAGIARYDGPAMTVEDMDAGIARGAMISAGLADDKAAPAT
jgi:AbrB family looped-hinge helix DNA binding protein